MKWTWQISEWKKDSAHITIYTAIILQGDSHINLQQQQIKQGQYSQDQLYLSRELLLQYMPSAATCKIIPLEAYKTVFTHTD